ncbi:T9SS type A sorting domain-containing protein [Paraflavitalea speifideaquila]|uniref:T9SS type A sorting domain-containing protein n=1 Tax=Paraflavitalea speifideaquila TaxID=3076558 RepID=UPI0028E554ED|nr:T9SS type A sorting domain-containing protein [Paraflavitalea speifideiaquila]
MASKGTGGGTYEWIDRDVVGGIKYYYRLKQIDINEQFRYSDIRMVTLGEQGSHAIRLWPNPVDKELQLTFEGSIAASQVLLKITDGQGRVVLLKDYRLSAGRKTTLNVVTLMQGQYYLSVEDGKTVLGVKTFVKQ